LVVEGAAEVRVVVSTTSAIVVVAVVVVEDVATLKDPCSFSPVFVHHSN
jgi:hypothetical protein